MKVRIKLKAKEDFGSIKEGESLVMINNLFDAMNGIAFFPIERGQWALISYDKCSDFKDKKNKEIFEKDYVEAICNPEDGSCKVFGNVVFEDGCFCIDIIEIKGKNCGYDIGQRIPFFDFKSVEVVSV